MEAAQALAVDMEEAVSVITEVAMAVDTKEASAAVMEEA